MNIFSKILIAILPLTFFNFAIAVGTTYYFSHNAILEHAEAWLSTRIVEAIKIIEEQEKLLNTYGLDGVPASVFKAKIDAATAIGQIEVGKFGYIFATDSDGTIVMHPDQSQLGKSIGNSILYQKIQIGEKRIRYDVDGERHLATYGLFPHWGMTIIVTDPDREIFKSISGMKPYLLSIGFAGAAFLTIILLLVIRRITNPLRSLAAGVERISSGDLTIRIPVQSKDEVGKLSHGFNKMARQIHHSHHELEQLVEERTKKLTLANEDLLQNIKEKNNAVEALKINEKRITAILRASPIGIGLVVDRRLKWVNDTMCSLVQYDRDTLLNQDVSIFYHSQEEFERLGKLLYENISFQDIVKTETKLLKKDGQAIDCSFRACHLDPSDHSKGIIVTVVDVTTAKIMEAKLQRSEKMEAIGTLAGGVAHDLNNILSGIISYPELLLLDLSEDSPLRKPLETIKLSGERASATVQDLLTMARRGVATKETINLNSVIREQLAGPEIKQLAHYHPEVQLIDHLEGNLANMTGSRPHVSKSIMNLVLNAAEAMVTGGLLKISTENVLLEEDYRGYELITAASYVVVTVEDNGVGIAETELGHIFEPFYTRKQMGRSGTGLGMAVVWGTVKDHEGFIDVESNEGIGSTFRLFFPSTDKQETIKIQPDPIESFKGNGETVLVVDDSELQREIAGKILIKLGYNVTSVGSGEEAVEYLRENETELLVLDMIMPDGMDGLDSYKEIQQLNPKQRIIIASGFSETDRIKELQSLSGGQYLKKPYTIEKLGKAVLHELKELS